MTEDRSHSHRRDFVKSLALGVGVAALSRPVATRGDDPKAEDDESREDEIDARMDLVLARYGEKLDDAARDAVRREVESVVRRGEALHAFKLDNGDAPFPIFRPYREPLS
jgi:hypothetical protein